MAKKLALHWWILIGMVLGVGYGVLAARLGATDHVLHYIKPVGTVFLNLLQMIAVPLVLFSLVAGVASLNDTAKLGRIGGKTIGLYLGTTAIAITIGLFIVNLAGPGKGITQAMRAELTAEQSAQAKTRIAAAKKVDIIDQIVGIVPKNPFEALANNVEETPDGLVKRSRPQMLSIVFFALMLGIAITRLSRDRAASLTQIFQMLTDSIIEMVHLIMKIAPLGVFALLAAVIAEMGKNPDHLLKLMGALLGYMGTVVLGLVCHLVIVYALLLKFVAHVPLRHFFRHMVPAQLLAFSSSSSAATLPVTMECTERIGVDEEVRSFVLPLGATVNMDGTGLYQGVATVFIANVFGHALSLGDQITIVLTAALASIGTAAVPGVGIIMLTIVLQQVGMGEFMAAGIALILGVDRPLDMARTVLNITGDATVATVVAATEGSLHAPSGSGTPDG